MSEQSPEEPVSGNPPPGRRPKTKGAPIQRSAKQQAAVEKAREVQDLAVQRTKAKEDAAQLAQVVNLVIAGHSFEEIGAAIGASAADIETMISTGADRYVRTQPALRAWVRKWISGQYTAMIAADIDQATNPLHPEKLEHQDRVMRMLVPLARLHGAEAPSQAEVKVEHSNDAVEALVRQLAERQGQGYDVSIFDGDDDEDTVDAEVVPDLASTVHDAAAQSLAAIESAAKQVDAPQPGDETL